MLDLTVALAKPLEESLTNLVAIDHAHFDLVLKQLLHGFRAVMVFFLGFISERDPDHVVLLIT
jgi:hypothetical protein